MNARKRIWELEQNLICPVIGTCLTVADTRKIIKRFGNFNNVTDYEAHTIAVSHCREENSLSRAIDRTLEATFSRHGKEVEKIDSEEELKDYWRKNFLNGSIAGPFWAIISRTEPHSNILSIVYGDVHMLSHRAVAEISELRSRIEALSNTVENLKDDKLRYRKIIRESNLEVIEARKISSRILHLEGELKKYKEHSHQNRPHQDSGLAFRELCRVIDITRAEKQKQKETASKLEDQKEENRRLKKQIKFLQGEINLIKSFTTETGKADKARLTCTNSSCPSYNVQGRTILYVGGRPSVISHCREVIESCGGKFIHHDGGIDESIGKIPNIIDNVDSVFFPVDCISHNASSSVKRLCKKIHKPVVFLKNSSVSAFTKEIEKIFGS